MRMVITPDKETLTIVFVGQLNPVIFQPEWFASNGIIGKDAIKQAKIEILHPDITIFRLNWLKIQVERNRFICEVSNSPLDRAFEIALKTFKEFLIYTPLFQMGINLEAHFKINSVEHWNEIGDKLAPKSPWGEWGESLLETSNNLGKRKGGLRTLVMEEGDRGDGYKGYIRAKIEPSTVVFPGLLAQVNDHYDLQSEAQNAEKITGCEKLMSVLESSYENSLKKSRNIINHIMSL